LLLDHEHEGLDAVPGDPNNYILGEIGGHNVVLAYPGAGEKGESAATYVASNMVRTFEKIRIGLLVGIAGGAPKPPDPKDPFADIRLGDVVVSSPVDGSGELSDDHFHAYGVSCLTIHHCRRRASGRLRQTAHA
jgi:hypothetical protein